MKFTMFADFHHAPGRFMRGSFEDLDFIFERAEKEKVDFIIHAGDLTHGPSNHPDFVKKYNEFHIPTYNCLGNHDADGTPYEETLKLYNMENGHYYFDNGGYRIIVMDPNYFEKDGKYLHYSMGNQYENLATCDWVHPSRFSG